jgi:hypothetical protein
VSNYTRSRRDLAAKVQVSLGARPLRREFDDVPCPYPMTWARHWACKRLTVGSSSATACGVGGIVVVTGVWVTAIHGLNGYRATQELYRPGEATLVDLIVFVLASGRDRPVLEGPSSSHRHSGF